MVMVGLGFNSFSVHAAGSPTISSINPTSVPIDSTYDATMVVIYGTNFDQDSYIVFDGVRGIAINPDSQSITGLVFHVPTSTTVGSHTIQVGERNSSLPLSNSVSLTTTVTPKASLSSDDKALLDQISSLLTQINTVKGQIASTQPASGRATSQSTTGPGYGSTSGSAPSSVSGLPSSAQNYSGGALSGAVVSAGANISLERNLKYGYRDAQTGGDVTKLQIFLKTNTSYVIGGLNYKQKIISKHCNWKIS